MANRRIPGASNQLKSRSMITVDTSLEVPVQSSELSTLSQGIARLMPAANFLSWQSMSSGQSFSDSNKRLDAVNRITLQALRLVTTRREFFRSSLLLIAPVGKPTPTDAWAAACVTWRSFLATSPTRVFNGGRSYWKDGCLKAARNPISPSGVPALVVEGVRKCRTLDLRLVNDGTGIQPVTARTRSETGPTYRSRFAASTVGMSAVWIANRS